MNITTHSAIDPSHTIMLRNVFASATRARFNKFRKNLISVIEQDDVFGLKTNRTPGPRAFAFPRSADKIAAFTDWLTRQIVDDVLQVSQPNQVGVDVNRSWINYYVQFAYSKGIERARTQLKGIAPSLQRTGGISIELSRPSHADKISFLFTQIFNDFRATALDMELQIIRVIAQSITEEKTTKEIVNQINEVIVGQRSSIATNAPKKTPSQKRGELIARTSVIKAFAEAQLQEFQNWDVHGVSAKAEISTTKDHRTCSKCAHLEGNVYTIAEARGVIPVHPLCRCIWIPFID
jgi:SPP1 gp7 family putative phage head morphogenesis protein